ncbi:MAG: cytochrome c oxidase subunit II [Pirellulales bacterium]
MQSVFPVLEPESPQARAIYDLLLTVSLICGVIFLITTGLLLIALWAGRKRRDLPRQDFGSHRKELAWMVAPVIVTLWITAITIKLILTISAVPEAHPGVPEGKQADLVVRGHQWYWEVQYPDTNVIDAGEIHIPVGKPLYVQLRSDDVIHCFWVPQLARKIDVIPGRDNYIWLEADKPGTYQGRCAEFCGTQHAWMNFLVIAHTEEDYAMWLAGKDPEAEKPTETDEEAGERLFFTEQTCVNCHAVQGTKATADIGPNLTHVARRKQLGGGILENSTENLALWLKNPQAIKPGCKMPNFKLTDEQVRQLVAYLESLP